MERLQRWSLIAEIVAAIAVVGSIGYLTVEVQRNTRAVQSQTSQGLLELANSGNVTIAVDPSLSDLLLRATWDLDAITVQERLRYRRGSTASSTSGSTRSTATSMERWMTGYGGATT
jgi:hypothetical protein